MPQGAATPQGLSVNPAVREVVRETPSPLRGTPPLADADRWFRRES
ncbi:hypothetical protein AAE250_17600 [Bacteroides sp. GD17]